MANTCPIHEDSPSPNCLHCKATVIDERTRLTETQRINTVREHLQMKAQQGLLGVVAARSQVAEGRLHDWCNDPSKVPNYGELIDIQAAMSLEVILDAPESDEETQAQQPLV